VAYSTRSFILERRILPNLLAAVLSPGAYTESKGTEVPGNFLMSPKIEGTAVVRALTIGFGLVILLLAVSAYIAISGARSIQSAAEELVRNHLTETDVIDNLQLAQQRLSTLLFDLVDEDKTVPLDRIDRLDQDIREATTAGSRAVQDKAWPRLADIGSRFAATARALIAAPPGTGDAIRDRLEALRREFTDISTELVRSQGAHAVGLERQIEQQSRTLTIEAVALIGACLLLSLAGAALTIHVTLRWLRILKWQSDELNRVSWQMLQTQEAAARRFSHEMHDELGQSLTGLKATLSGVKPEEFALRRTDCVHLLDEAIGNVRELSQLLRPVILDDFGLSAGLRWLAERFTVRTRIEVDCVCDVEERLADEIETHLFRITQEALTNIAKHSQAKRAHIRLTGDSERVRLTIEDDGVGLAPSQPKRPTLGMVGMRARARQMGGELTLSAGKPHGVRIEVWAPRKEADAYATEKDPGLAS
jgi:signal transduction histidine kinase